jgi:hypothetical protein
VKLCIELDEETYDKWKKTKRDLKDHFEIFQKHRVKITDSVVFQCLLYCYTYDDGIPVVFARSYEGDLEILQ